jgi:hypothetical protein
VIDQGLVKGAESASGKAAEKGLEVLLRTVAGRSTTGLVINISLFFSVNKLGGEKPVVSDQRHGPGQHPFAALHGYTPGQGR